MSKVEELKEKLTQMKVAGIDFITVDQSSYSDGESLASEILEIIKQYESGNTTGYTDH